MAEHQRRENSARVQSGQRATDLGIELTKTRAITPGEPGDPTRT
jgi:hypothetical protein